MNGTVACPACGSRNPQQLAPGYFECRAEVLVDVARGPHAPPAGIPVYRPCGNRFQVGHGAPAATCACGMFAVGRCSSCQAAVCGVHGQHAEGRFLCGACTAASERAGRQKQAVAAQAARNAHEQELRAWVERVRAEVADVHPIERLIRILAVCVERPGHASNVYVNRDALEALGTGLPPVASELLERPLWDHQRVQDFHVKRAIDPLRSVLVEEPVRRGRFKERRIEAWVFNEGRAAPMVSFRGPHGYEGAGRGSVAVTVDGRRYACGPSSASRFRPDPSAGFNVIALLEIGENARLRALPAPPRLVPGGAGIVLPG